MQNIDVKIVKLSELNIDFYNIIEAAYHFEDDIDNLLEISDLPVQVGVFQGVYFLEDGHHRVLKKIEDSVANFASLDFSKIEIDTILKYHHEEPNYLNHDDCKYGKLKEWYEDYYEIKL